MDSPRFPKVEQGKKAPRPLSLGIMLHLEKALSFLLVLG